MQLKKKTGNIAGLLAAASCSLLNQSVNAQETDAWHVDTAVLVYSEKDRVDAVEPVVSVTRTFSDESKLNVKLVTDTLTGASPNGASITDQAQTFTRPSGRGEYVTKAGDIPLDDTFKDSRTAISAQYEFPLDRLTRISTGLHFSDEYDYRSIGFNGSIARDFNNKNTTLSLGIAYAKDTIEPQGGIPIAFASMAPAREGSEREGDEREGVSREGTDDDKTISDFLIGVTQVINRKTIMQLNYSYSKSDGYLTDPFKILSVVDGSSGATLDYLYENRPDTRVKNSVYWKTKYHRDNGHIIDFSYRYLWDDWEVTSHTLDFRYHFPITKNNYIEPHIRYYQQDEAEFYQHALVAGAPLVKYASADSRLGSFDGITIGVKYGYKFSENSEVNFRVEYYEQKGDTVGQTIGIQNNYDLFPDLEAVIVQLGYSFNF